MIQRGKHFDVLECLLIGIGLYLLAIKIVPKLKQLGHVLGCLFENDQTVDIPGVESDSVVAVVNHFGQELQDHDHDIIVIVEGVQ